MLNGISRLLVISMASVAMVFCATAAPSSAADDRGADGQKTMRVLFIGNSYTARHNLAQVAKAMAEAGQPGLTFEPTTVIYGGRTLADHWRLGSQNFVRLHSLTRDEEQQTLKSLEKLSQDPKDKYAGAALRKHKELLKQLDSTHSKWDLVVLQSYRDDLGEQEWGYEKFAPRFAALAKKQGARVLLYETTPTTQNAKPLTTRPDEQPILEKARRVAALADRVEADAAPMSLVALRCQQERPDLTLRFVNDAHLNQTLAYLTACTMYSAIFERSPVGLEIDSVTDIRFLDNTDRSKDRDGLPITRKFNKTDRTQLQKIAWDAYLEFQKMRMSEDE